jgi:hypothetical protein
MNCRCERSWKHVVFSRMLRRVTDTFISCPVTCQAGTYGSWSCSFVRTQPRRQTGLDGKHQASAALPTASVAQHAGWASGPDWMGPENLTRTMFRTLDLSARS